MKKLIVCLLALCTVVTVKSASFLDGVKVSPYAALEHPDFGAPQWGAGVDVGFELNKYVTLSADLMSLEQNSWGGSTIDRASLLATSSLFNSANKKFNIYGIGGGGFNFNTDNALFTVGLGVKYAFSKHVEVFADSRVYSEFKGDVGESSRMGLSYKF